jgi:hypothetical protein
MAEAARELADALVVVNSDEQQVATKGKAATLTCGSSITSVHPYVEDKGDVQPAGLHDLRVGDRSHLRRGRRRP